MPSAEHPSQEGNWWTRPCGGLEVLRLALPLVISTGSLSLLLFVDRMFLAWYDHGALAGSFASSMLHWTMVGFPLGVAMYVNTFVAQYYGDTNASAPSSPKACGWARRSFRCSCW
jgi:Na+-driven multidrug efflux pump